MTRRRDIRAQRKAALERDRYGLHPDPDTDDTDDEDEAPDDRISIGPLDVKQPEQRP